MSSLLLTNTDLRLKEEFRRSYRFTMAGYTRIQEQTTENEFTRELDMEYIPAADPSGLSFCSFSVHREKMLLDHRSSHLEYIIQAVSSVTQEVHFHLQETTGTVTLANWNDIRNKWTAVKEKLWNDYKGTEIQRFTEGYENRMQNKQALTASLLQYNLYGLFMNRIHIRYGYTGQQTENRDIIPLFGNTALPVQELRTVKNTAEGIKVDISGSIDENRLDTTALGHFAYHDLSLAENEDTDLLLQRYSGHYNLEQDTCILQKALLQYNIAIGDAYQRKCRFHINTIEPSYNA
ncbi:hypothetical protein [Chitinophaga flava]|uniref:Uncharacterized protein n=1 Tax=Chitinophaga flava TaxID=2259036 RepID=A0A365XWC0_9BACT|nr:hypothetical protein [Chitinophaga flava]RBL90669.1 hypothetical protein DF182_29920 [Chitinophaga flava]